MAQKQYPNTEVGWIDYLTNQRYLTLNEIEYRKPIVEKSGCDFDEIFNEIRNYKTYTDVATRPTYTKLATQPSPLL